MELRERERLTALEIRMSHTERLAVELKEEVKDLQRTVWKAMGAVAVIAPVISFLLQLALKKL